MALNDNLFGLFIATTGDYGNNLLFRHPLTSERFTKNDCPTLPYPLKSSILNDDNQRYNDSQKEPICVNISHYSDQVLANLLVAGKSDLCDRGFNLQIENILFIGYTKRISIQTQKNEKSDTNVMNISFAISLNVDVYSGILQKLANQICTAIIHEKKRSLHGIETSNKNQTQINDNLLCESTMHPSLCKFLRQIYEAVKSNNWVDVHLNKWIRIHSFLTPNADTSLSEDRSAILGAMKPYHSLLLLKDKEYITNQPFCHCSPTLTSFFRSYNPARNFISIASDAMLSPLHVKNIASNLVMWGYADIIYPLHDANIYAICPNIDFTILFDSFNKQFNSITSITLVEILVEFSIPAPLKDHREALRLFLHTHESQVFIWLLKNKVLYQAHTYVYNIFESNDTSNNSANENYMYNSIDLAVSVKSDEGGEDVSNFSVCSENQTWLKSFADFSISSRNSILGYEDEKLYHRLTSLYFNGKHHLEEILFLEKIPRSFLLTMIDKYRNKLLLCEHEDPTICML